MAQSAFKAWLAASMLGVAVAMPSLAETSGLKSPPTKTAKEIVVCIHFGPIVPQNIVLEVVGEDSGPIASVIADDLNSTAVYRVIDPTRPDAPDPDAIVRVSTNRLEDGSIGADVEFLDLGTKEPPGDVCSTGAPAKE